MGFEYMARWRMVRVDDLGSQEGQSDFIGSGRAAGNVRMPGAGMHAPQLYHTQIGSSMIDVGELRHVV